MKIKIELTPEQTKEVLWAIYNFTGGDDADCGTATRRNTLQRAAEAIEQAKIKANLPVAKR